MKTFSFICSTCGKTHEGSPSFGFSAPYYYDVLTENEKTEIARLSDDFCLIEYGDQTDRFIRTVIEVPIRGCENPFIWGVWISLSEENYTKYRDNFTCDTYTDNYFGWLCNQLPYYPSTLNLKTRATVVADGNRPKLTLEAGDHEFAKDFSAGISWEKAMKIAEEVMHAPRT